MVQKKGPDIASPKTESKKNQSKQEKHLPSQDQEARKKLRKARSIKRLPELEDLAVHLGHQHLQPCCESKQQPPPRAAAPPNCTKKQQPPVSRSPEVVISPNYMKPTTSSDARKERLQVITTHESPPNDDKKTNPVLGKKPAKFLARNPSLKPARTATKKCPASPLFPDVSTSKATCSSILKDARFPRELELAPGSTEAEGTSTMKVCPFTYCSLNGHWHQPLPPLKSFISARRRLLKTQKSIKLKRLASSRRRISKKNDKTPPNEDPGDGFFVEIHAKSYEESAESAVFDLSNYGDDEEDCNDDEDEDDMDSETFSELIQASTKQGHVSSLDGCYSDTGYDDGDDQKGEFSTSEKEVLAGFLEFIDNQEDESEMLDKENCKWEDGGYLSMDSSDIGEQLSDTEAYETLLEAIDANQGDSSDARSVEGGLEAACTNEHDAEHVDIHQKNMYEDQELEFLQSVCGYEFSDQDSEESVGESPYMDDDDDQKGSDGTLSMDEMFFSLMLIGLEEDSTEGGIDDRDFKQHIDHEENVSLEEIEFLRQLFSESTPESDEEGASEVLELDSMVSCKVPKESYLIEDAFSSTEAEAESEVGVHEQHKNLILSGDEDADSDEIEFLEQLFCESTREMEKEEVTEVKAMVQDVALEIPHIPAYAFNSTEAEAEAEVGIHEHLLSESVQESKECADEVSKIKAMAEDEVLEDPYLLDGALSSPEAVGESADNAYEQHTDPALGASEGVETEAAAKEEATDGRDLSPNADNNITCSSEHQLESETTYENSEEGVARDDDETRTSDGIKNVDGETKCPHRNRYTRNSKHSPSEDGDELQLKLNIVRRNICEDSDDELNEFHPRAPNFLEVEPDPEAEKVDLRHQAVDERKSSEEWMIDHALQEAVNKLALARKKKVALIVEAIETVAPTHMHQPPLSPLKHGDIDHTQARSFQASS